jgi:molybdate transport system ATP-binding protein
MLRVDVVKRLASVSGTHELRFDVTLAPGELAAVFGRSGAGKTTLLRLIAGLTRPDEGRIEVDGRPWFDGAAGIDLPPRARDVGLVFQEYALFPHLSVRDNVAFGVRRDARPRLVDELLAATELTEVAERRPATLSGGQQQRVALARALAREPRVLLLDEPLAALDGALRRSLQRSLATLHALRPDRTTLLVSHDLTEVFRLARRVVLVEEGRVARVGAPHAVFAPQALGERLALAGEIVALERSDVVFVATVLVGQTAQAVVVTEAEAASLAVGDHVLVAVPPLSPLVVTL